MKKIALLLISFSLLFSLFGCDENNDISSHETDFIQECVTYPENIQEATDQKDLIVLGKVQKTDAISYRDPQWIALGRTDYWSYMNLATFVVEETLKGDVQKGEKLLVGQSGDGVARAYSSVYNGCGYLQENDYCLLFLGKVDAEKMRTALENGNRKAKSYIGKETWSVSSILSMKLDKDGNILKQDEITAEIFFDNVKTLQEVREKLK